MVDCISFNHMKNSIQLKINCCCRKVCQNVLKTESLPHQSNVPSKLAGKKKCGRKLRQEKNAAFRSLSRDGGGFTETESTEPPSAQNELQLQQRPTSEESVRWSRVSSWQEGDSCICKSGEEQNPSCRNSAEMFPQPVTFWNNVPPAAEKF